MVTKTVFELRDTKRSVYASAIVNKNELFNVLKGSACFQTKRKNDNYKNLRDKLIRDNILVPSEADMFIFTKNYLFNSATAAASVIMGGNASGPFSWKLRGSNLCYKDWKSSVGK